MALGRPTPPSTRPDPHPNPPHTLHPSPLPSQPVTLHHTGSTPGPFSCAAPSPPLPTPTYSPHPLHLWLCAGRRASHRQRRSIRQSRSTWPRRHRPPSLACSARSAPPPHTSPTSTSTSPTSLTSPTSPTIHLPYLPHLPHISPTHLSYISPTHIYILHLHLICISSASRRCELGPDGLAVIVSSMDPDALGYDAGVRVGDRMGRVMA